MNKPILGQIMSILPNLVWIMNLVWIFFIFCTAPHQTGRVNLCVYKNPVVIWFSHDELYSMWKQDMEKHTFNGFLQPTAVQAQTFLSASQQFFDWSKLGFIEICKWAEARAGRIWIFLIWATTKVVLLQTVGQNIANWCHGRPPSDVPGSNQQIQCH